MLVIGLIAAVFYFVFVAPLLHKLETRVVKTIDDNLIVVEGGGGNSGIIMDDSVVLVIDTKMGDAAGWFADTVKSLAGDRDIVVVNTHFHPDHTEGNRHLEGATIIAGAGYSRESWLSQSAEEDIPTEWLTSNRQLIMDDDTVTIFTLGIVAHTPGDVFVYLHNRKTLFGGDVILNAQVPYVSDGDPNGYLQAFDMIQRTYQIEHVVPGHGPTGDATLIDLFRQYFNDMKTAAADKSRRGELLNQYRHWDHVPFIMSSEQVVSAFQ